MDNIPILKRPFAQSLRYGFLTLLFSHLPLLIVYLLHLIKNGSFPDFAFIFDSGRIVAIWIPILGMLIITFYEVRAYKQFPFLEWLSYILIIVFFILITVLYTYYYYQEFEYYGWMKWMFIVVVSLLFVFLVFSKYLECSASGDLQAARAKDQDELRRKYSELN